MPDLKQKYQAEALAYAKAEVKEHRRFWKCHSSMIGVGYRESSRILFCKKFFIVFYRPLSH